MPAISIGVQSEDNSRKRKICSYKSGSFKDSLLHHHSTFKELLEVKMGIIKFESHLIGHQKQTLLPRKE